MDLFDGFLTLVGAAVGIATQLCVVPTVCSRCHGAGHTDCSTCHGRPPSKLRRGDYWGCFMCYDRGSDVCYACSGTGEGSDRRIVWSQP